MTFNKTKIAIELGRFEDDVMMSVCELSSDFYPYKVIRFGANRYVNLIQPTRVRLPPTNWLLINVEFSIAEVS